ncbi:MAG: hypothetical protein GDA50_02935 [Alphaproteobacteria bacterium GM202ARS2]|nr:hypothetical protein [Alphaproteobacteria bacterium GM202ARS2]
MDVRDAFLQYELIDDIVVYVGRRRQVWGQFDLFSPVGVLLPVRFQNNAVDFKKTNYVVPQDNASLSWFLGERLELQGHFFLSTQIDPLLEEVIEQDGSRQDVEDHRQYAGRLVYRPDWGTLGLTFYRGRSALFQYNENASLADEGSLDGEQADLPPITAYAFELAIPSGRWVWKAEVVYRESKGDLPSYEGIASSPDTDVVAYINAIRNNNGGSFVVDTTELFAGIGVDARLNDWLVNFGVYLVSIDEDADVGGGRDLRDLADRALGDGGSLDDDGDETVVFPTLNVVRYFGDDDRYTLGLSGGFLVAALGVAVYGTARIGDNLSLYAGVDLVQSITDVFVEQTEERPFGSAADYELQDEVSFGARFGLRYAF